MRARSLPFDPAGVERNDADDGQEQLHSRTVVDLFLRTVRDSDGSSNAWLYGKDQTYYYHFTYRVDAPYVYIAQKNTCRGFDRTDVRTWCSVRTGAPRAAAGKKI